MCHKSHKEPGMGLATLLALIPLYGQWLDSRKIGHVGGVWQMHKATLMRSCFLPGACSLAAKPQKGLWEEWTEKLDSLGTQ